MLRMIGHTRGSNCNVIVISIKLGVFKLGSKAKMAFRGVFEASKRVVEELLARVNQLPK